MTHTALQPRLCAAADLLRELSADLNVAATRIDAQPQGYSDAYRLIVVARDVSALAYRLDAVAREVRG